MAPPPDTATPIDGVITNRTFGVDAQGRPIQPAEEPARESSGFPQTLPPNPEGVVPGPPPLTETVETLGTPGAGPPPRVPLPEGIAPGPPPLTETVETLGGQGPQPGGTFLPPGPPRPVPPPPVGGGNPLVPEGVPAIGLGSLGGLIERQLANPSRFGAPQAQEAFNFFSGDLQRQADEAANRARVGAASRGVFFGSGGLNQEQRARQPFQTAQGQLATNLALSQAQTGSQDLNAAIANAFRFGENQQQADQFAANLGLQTSQFGFEGAPGIDQAIGAFGGLPLPGAPPGLGPTLESLARLAALLRQQGGGGSTQVTIGGGQPGGNLPVPDAVPPGINVTG